MAAFLTDNFTGTDDTQINSHTPDTGGAWASPTGGMFYISSNRMRTPNDGVVTAPNNTAPTLSDYYVEGVFYPATVPAAGKDGLMGRYTDTSNYYRAYVDLAAGNIVLERVASGSPTSLGTYAFTPTATVAYTLRLVISGSANTVSLTVKLNGSTVISYADSAGSRLLLTGKAGLWHGSGAWTSSTGIHADSVTADILSTIDFVKDTFTGTDATLLTAHTGETGATWTKNLGNDAAISANRAAGGSGISLFRASGAPPAGEYFVEANLYVNSVSSAWSSGVAARIPSSSADTCYTPQLNTDGNLRLYLVSAGSETQLGIYNANGGSLSNGLSHYVRMTVSDTAKRVTYKSVPDCIVSTDNTVSAAGSCGIRYKSAAIHVDDFRAFYTGVSGVTGTGASTTHKPTTSGSAKVGARGTGASTTHKPTTSGQAKVGARGTGASTMHKPTDQGAAFVTIRGTGASTTHKPTDAGTASAQPIVQGIGASTTKQVRSAGTGKIFTPVSGTGASTMHKPTDAGRARGNSFQAYVYEGGEAKPVEGAWVYVDGGWRRVLKAYVSVSGVWQRWF